MRHLHTDPYAEALAIAAYWAFQPNFDLKIFNQIDLVEPEIAGAEAMARRFFYSGLDLPGIIEKSAAWIGEQEVPGLASRLFAIGSRRVLLGFSETSPEGSVFAPATGEFWDGLADRLITDGVVSPLADWRSNFMPVFEFIPEGMNLQIITQGGTGRYFCARKDENLEIQMDGLGVMAVGQRAARAVALHEFMHACFSRDMHERLQPLVKRDMPDTARIANPWEDVRVNCCAAAIYDGGEDDLKTFYRGFLKANWVKLQKQDGPGCAAGRRWLLSCARQYDLSESIANASTADQDWVIKHSNNLDQLVGFQCLPLNPNGVPIKERLVERSVIGEQAAIRIFKLLKDDGRLSASPESTAPQLQETGDVSGPQSIQTRMGQNQNRGKGDANGNQDGQSEWAKQQNDSQNGNGIDGGRHGNPQDKVDKQAHEDSAESNNAKGQPNQFNEGTAGGNAKNGSEGIDSEPIDSVLVIKRLGGNLADQGKQGAEAARQMEKIGAGAKDVIFSERKIFQNDCEIIKTKDVLSRFSREIEDGARQFKKMRSNAMAQSFRSSCPVRDGSRLHIGQVFRRLYIDKREDKIFSAPPSRLILNHARFIIVVDGSRSMTGENIKSAAIMAGASALALEKAGYQTGMVGFSDGASIIYSTGDNPAVKFNKIKTMAAAADSGEPDRVLFNAKRMGWSNTKAHAAVWGACASFLGDRNNLPGTHHVLFFTDGELSSGERARQTMDLFPHVTWSCYCYPTIHKSAVQIFGSARTVAVPSLGVGFMRQICGGFLTQLKTEGCVKDVTTLDNSFKRTMRQAHQVAMKQTCPAVFWDPRTAARLGR